MDPRQAAAGVDVGTAPSPPCGAKPPQSLQRSRCLQPPPAPASGSWFPSCFGKVRAALVFLGLLHFHWRLFGAGPQEMQISCAEGRDNISAQQCKISSGLLSVTKPQRQPELSVLETQQGRHIMAPAFGQISCLIFSYFFLQVSDIPTPHLFNLPPLGSKHHPSSG